MSSIPRELQYTRSHEWVRRLPDGRLEVGITDHAQSALGDLVFVEVPETGRSLRTGEECAVVESVKAASDVYSPVDGTVVAGNPDLAGRPELINQDPYGAGWLFRAQADGAAGGADLMNADGYEKYLAEQAH